MKVGIINASPFYRDLDGRCFTSSDEEKSLSQWYNLYDKIVLFRPEQTDGIKAKEWLKLPENVECRSLGNINLGAFKRKIVIRKVAKAANDCDIFYYRIPNYESYLFWRSQPKSPYYVEIHGDMESAIMSGNKPWIIKKMMSKYFFYLFQKISSQANFALTIGPALRNKYIKSNIATYVTTNHLLFKEDYPKSCVIRPQNRIPLLLFVGHIHDRKGLRYLFKALKMMHEEGKPFIMKLAGTGQLQSWLEKYATDNGFIDCVHFLGQIKHGPDLFKLYQEADLFVLPSTAAEGVPRVIHEAMAFCTPVVATNIGSVKWQLNGECGVVLEPADAKALKNAIDRVLEDEGLRNKLIVNGYKKSLRFSLEEQKKGILKFVTKQLSNLSLS